MKGPLVLKTLADEKTQTRRIMKVQPCKWATHVRPAPIEELPGYGEPGNWIQASKTYQTACGLGGQCPYGQPGDRLWVRETWLHIDDEGGKCDGMGSQTYYRTHNSNLDYESLAWMKRKGLKWRPSIFMPRKFCRLVLEITEIRAQRLQEITEADATAEGVGPTGGGNIMIPNPNTFHFQNIWDSINKKRGFSWESNPWVWAITYKRIS